MSDAPIIGGNWRSTEPAYRKPAYSPKRSLFYKLNGTELDTLDALLIRNRASSMSELHAVLKGVYPREDSLYDPLARLVKFGCVEKSFRRNPGVNYDDLKASQYQITQKGIDIFNEVMDWLEARMMEKGGRGIRRH